MMNARARWEAKIAEKVKAGVDPTTAARMVNKENPGLREAMLAQHNAANGNEKAAAKFGAQAAEKGYSLPVG